MLSPVEYPLIWMVVFGVSAIALVSFALLIKQAGQSVTRVIDREHYTAISQRLRVILVVWPAIAILYALIVGLDFASFLPLLIIPLLLGVYAMTKEPMTQMLNHIALPLLIALSFYRVAGGIFLYAYYEYDLLTYGFAFNAGWGDVLTGVLAPIVALMVYWRMPVAFYAVVIWTIIGIGDLILAPISANLYGAKRLVDFPLNLIPLFLGPPFGIFLHLVTVRAAWLQLKKTE